jgi:hypothetical protein
LRAEDGTDVGKTEATVIAVRQDLEVKLVEAVVAARDVRLIPVSIRAMITTMMTQVVAVVSLYPALRHFLTTRTEMICLGMEAVSVAVFTQAGHIILVAVVITAMMCDLRQIQTLLRRPGTKCRHMLLKRALFGHQSTHQGSRTADGLEV